MWRTLALASAFFPGLFVLCIRLLRCAAPGWSLKDRILLSGRYGRDRREATRTAAGGNREREPERSGRAKSTEPRRLGACNRGVTPTPGSPELRPPARGAGAVGRHSPPRVGSPCPAVPPRRGRYPFAEQRCSGAALPPPAGNRAGLPLIHGSGRDETWKRTPPPPCPQVAAPGTATPAASHPAGVRGQSTSSP